MIHCRCAHPCENVAERWSMKVCTQTMHTWSRRLKTDRSQPRPYHPSRDPDAEVAFKKQARSGGPIGSVEAGCAMISLRRAAGKFLVDLSSAKPWSMRPPLCGARRSDISRNDSAPARSPATTRSSRYSRNTITRMRQPPRHGARTRSLRKFARRARRPGCGRSARRWRTWWMRCWHRPHRPIRSCAKAGRSIFRGRNRRWTFEFGIGRQTIRTLRV